MLSLDFFIELLSAQEVGILLEFSTVSRRVILMDPINFDIALNVIKIRHFLFKVEPSWRFWYIIKAKGLGMSIY